MKNLKMFAIAVMAFAVMATGVHAVDCDTSAVAKSETKCYTEAQLIASSAETDALYADNVITLIKNVTLTSNLEIDKNITIDLGDDFVITFNTANQGIVLKDGGNLTLKGTGEVKNTAGTSALIDVQAGATLNVEGSVILNNLSTGKETPAIMINGTDGKTTAVTVGKDVTIKSAAYGLVVGKASADSAPGVTVNMAGTWETEGYVAKVNGTIKYASKAPVINVEEGTYKSAKSTALYASGYATWNIKGGSVEGAQAVEVRSGNVNISGGTFKGTNPKAGGTGFTGANATKNGSALIVKHVANYEEAKRINLNVTGGTFTSEKSYAMYIKDLGEKGTLSLSNVKMTSGKEGSTQLAAIKIDDTNDAATSFIEHHNDMIVSGEFTGDVFEKVETSSGTFATPAELAADLVKGELKTEGGNTTVGTPSDEGQQPGTTEPGDQTTGDGNQGPTDNVKNPETNDNILVYAGLGLVSLASVAFTAKKRED